VLKEYSKWTGQKFVVDPAVKAKVTILSPQPVARDEAFNLLSSAMASNGFAISKQGDTMYVSSARNIQRNLLEVTTELPSLKPERMVTWVINLKYVKADEVNKQLRILTSRDGELVPFTDRNQLIVTDWSSNLHRIGQIVSKTDIPAPTTKK
jgi:general secretion pathway protein D